jgi:hypothetical protein
MAGRTLRVYEVDGTSFDITIPTTPMPTVKALVAQVGNRCRVSPDNVRLIIHGKVCADDEKIYDLVTSRDDFFIANVIYSHTSPPPDPISEPVRRLMNRGYTRETAERALREANGDVERAVEFLRF